MDGGFVERLFWPLGHGLLTAATHHHIAVLLTVLSILRTASGAVELLHAYLVVIKSTYNSCGSSHFFCSVV